MPWQAYRFEVGNQLGVRVILNHCPVLIIDLLANIAYRHSKECNRENSGKNMSNHFYSRRTFEVTGPRRSTLISKSRTTRGSVCTDLLCPFLYERQ